MSERNHCEIKRAAGMISWHDEHEKLMSLLNLTSATINPYDEDKEILVLLCHVEEVLCCLQSNPISRLWSRYEKSIHDKRAN